MKILKKILIFIMVLLIITTLPINTIQNNIYVGSNITTNTPLKVGVFLFNFDDPYMSLVKQSLEDIQRKNQDKVVFNFFDARGNQTIQNESIEKALKEDFDLLIINLVDPRIDLVQSTLNKIIQKNVPLILYGQSTPDLINFIKSYRRALFITTDFEQSGALQGKIIINKWNSDKSNIDKNKDNIMQYVMLNGSINNPAAIARTKYSISTINNSGIKTEQLALEFCEWNEELAKNAVESLFLKYGNKIEVIIANNDAMAIGAVKALQKYGYNKDDNTKIIPVVGVDAIPEAQDLIKKGFMTGTVFQDPHAAAEALYTVGMNLALNKYPLDNTTYKFDNTGVVIRLPYEEYIK